jgi:predicted  nucleic acid-binding Zn-ribbon protein
MTSTLNQLEKNLGVSFSYVKKDLLSVNDMVSDLHDKIQHLSLNQALLLEKVTKLESKLTEKTTSKKKIPSKNKTSKKTAKKKSSGKPIKKVVEKTTVYQ